MDFKIDKKAMKDISGRSRTQSLFLELGYGDEAIYTLKEDHWEYNGKIYPSIKKLYLEAEDPTEYEFANTWFMNWTHWQRVCENKAIKPYIEQWREELEIRLRSKAVRSLMYEASKGSYQAAKWLADRGWDNRGAGRPSKLDKEKRAKVNDVIQNEFQDDVIRLFPVKHG